MPRIARFVDMGEDILIEGLATGVVVLVVSRVRICLEIHHPPTDQRDQQKEPG